MTTIANDVVDDHFKVQLISNVIPYAFGALFRDLDNEVQWVPGVTHLDGPLPREFALQADIISDKIPLYRHPMDQALIPVQFTPTVDKIRKALEEKIGKTLNHAIIQKYRHGGDYISEHADKTLDIVPGSLIVNFTAGGARTMFFRSKKPLVKASKDAVAKYDIRRFDLTDNTALLVDVDDTNRYYRHSIHRDRSGRLVMPRISITFRTIGTFLNPETNVVEGIGALIDDGDVISSKLILYQWGLENTTTMAREDLYPNGFSFASLNEARLKSKDDVGSADGSDDGSDGSDSYDDSY